MVACSLLTALSPREDLKVSLVSLDEKKIRERLCLIRSYILQIYNLQNCFYLSSCEEEAVGWTVRSEVRRRFVDSLKNELVVNIL